jgi:D-arabinonate dehydratase/D-galactarolactone cycloisomerase
VGSAFNFQDLDAKITGIKGFALSSPYGSGSSLGQPLGVKSVGLIEVHTDIGVSGLGETYAGVYVPELIGPTATFLEALLVGIKVGDAAALKPVSDIPFIGRNGLLRSVLSAIDIAIWDVRGKILQRPVYSLFGSSPVSRVPVYASSGTAAFSPAEIRQDAEKIMDLGYRAYKMRAGYQDWGIDIQRIEAARDVLGETRDLMVDAIMGTLRPAWSIETALKRVASLKNYGLRWLEEPLHPDNIKGLAQLRASSCGSPSIAAGEAYTSLGEYAALIDEGAVDVLQFDATHSGGISACLRLTEETALAKLNNALHVWGSAVALSANAHVAIGTGAIDIVEVPMVRMALAEEMWITPPVIADGWLQLSDAPGLGIQLTDETRERYSFVPGSGYRLPT